MSEEYSALKNHFLKIFRHMKWADIRVIKLLEEENISSGKAVELISHVIITEDIYFKRITNEYYDNKFWNVLTLEECRRIVDDTNQKFIDYILNLTEKNFQNKISYKNSRGVDYNTSIEDMLSQVALHGMYHRGQIMVQMRNSGHNITETDYVLYTREVELGEAKL